MDLISLWFAFKWGLFDVVWLLFGFQNSSISGGVLRVQGISGRSGYLRVDRWLFFDLTLLNLHLPKAVSGQFLFGRGSLWLADVSLKLCYNLIVTPQGIFVRPVSALLR